MKVRSTLVGGGLAAVLVLASCGGDDDSTKEGQAGPASPAATVAPPADSFKVGDVVKLGATEVIVHGLQDPFDAGQQKPPAGARFVAVDVEMKNVGESTVIFSAFGQFELRDATDAPYDAIVLRGKPPAVGGPAAPGASRRGLIAYQVPEGAQGLRLVFKDRLVGKGDASISLT